MIKCKAIEILLLPAADCDLRLLQKPFIGLHGHALLRPAGLQSIRQIILRSSHFDGHEGTMKRRKNKAINRFVRHLFFDRAACTFANFFLLVVVVAAVVVSRVNHVTLTMEDLIARSTSCTAINILGEKPVNVMKKKVASGRCQSYRLRRSLEMRAISDKVNKRKNYEGHTSAND